jgi:flagellin
MTRINTNVSSLVARNTLGRSNAALEQSLTRLSTGLRINTGKDDPAGLIASENLRSDITSIKKAISNTDRANQVIATADSALGQVSSLLNDIRGLVTESANSGALSDAQIAANQLQLDESLNALNRIAQTTSFQGRKLLDGSLDFTTTAGTNFNRINDLQIDQANLGSTGSVAVAVAISSAATQAQVDVDNIPVATASAAATTTATFTNTVVQSVNTLTVSGDAITITSQAGGAHEGDAANSPTDFAIVFGAGSAGAVYDTNTGILTVSVTQADGVATTANIQAAIDGTADFVATGGDASTVSAAQATAATLVNATAGRDAGSAAVVITAANAGTSFNAKTVTVVESNTVTTSAPTAVDDGSGNITITVNDTGVTDLDDVIAAIDLLDDYSAAAGTTTGDGNYNAATQTVPVVANTAGGVAASGGITDDLVFELAGADGSEIFSVLAGTGISELVSQINLVSDATGVSATANGTTLELTSTAYGSDAFVDLKIKEEGTGQTASGTFTDEVGAGLRDAGTDVVAKVNGIDANGTGNRLSVNTATLDLKLDVAAQFIGNIAFTITGGGALFQLGPDVVSNQQARIGIGSVNTAALGGVSGLLYELASGNAADLSTDLTTAADIVEEAIDQVTTLRGRLGAFQRTLLETNKQALSDTLINLTDAESQIRDADFAAESAALTRAQILVQSGTTVLQIANSNPQNVLALLR